MSNVTFNEGYKKRRGGDKTTVIGRLVIKLSGGMVKDQKQANNVILITTILIFVATLFVLFT